MTSELEHLEGLGRQHGDSAATAYPDLAARARRVTDRLAQGRFDVAVLGEFKLGSDRKR